MPAIRPASAGFFVVWSMTALGREMTYIRNCLKFSNQLFWHRRLTVADASVAHW